MRTLQRCFQFHHQQPASVHCGMCLPVQVGGCRKNSVSCMEDPPTAGQQTLNDGGDEGKRDKHPVRLLTLFVVEPGQ